MSGGNYKLVGNCVKIDVEALFSPQGAARGNLDGFIDFVSDEKKKNSL